MQSEAGSVNERNAEQRERHELHSERSGLLRGEAGESVELANVIDGGLEDIGLCSEELL